MTHRRGAIRLRSNVVMANDADALWDLVPGEIVEDYKPHRLSRAGASRRQRDEKGYYLECSYCERLAHEIGRDGCDDARCLGRPSEAQIAVARARHEDALSLISAEMEHLKAETVSTEDDDLPALLGPDEAVARFLGLAALTHDETLPEGEPDGGSMDVAGSQATARQVLIGAAAATGRFSGAYCAQPLDNIVDTVTLGQARGALGQLERGDGGELKAALGGSIKFCAAYSSSALAVNSFAAWIGHEKDLVIDGRSSFERLEFEVKFPTGLQGKPPNLDVVVAGTNGLVAIESKCTEYLRVHEATFPISYDDVVSELADPSWQDLHSELKADPELLPQIDAGQLLRHYLGLRRAIADGAASAATLLYLFWEPPYADAPFAAHRQAFADLASRVTDPTVELLSMSYEALWSAWETDARAPWVGDHVGALRARYFGQRGD